MADKISYQTASDIDRSWSDARWPSDGLRIVPLKDETLLTIPDTDDAPTYRWRSHDPKTGEFAPAFYHVSGPTLADWQAQDEAEFMAQWQEARQEARELYEFASGR